MMRLSAALVVLAAAPVGTWAAQSTFNQELWIGGRLGVGVSSPAARLEVRAASTTAVPLQVSGWFAAPLFTVAADGSVALGTTPAANLDVAGADISGLIAVELRGGATDFSGAAWQALFGYAGQALYRHGLKSAHPGSVAGNGLGFYLWTPAAGTAGSLPVVSPLALVTHSTGVSVHIRPVAQTPDVELVVSNGSGYGQGAVRVANEGSHSSSGLKRDIERLGYADEAAALEETRLLKHASFKYKRDSRVRRGLIYEDAPSSLRAPGDSLVVDERVVNSELSLKALIRRLEDVERKMAGSAEGTDR